MVPAPLTTVRTRLPLVLLEVLPSQSEGGLSRLLLLPFFFLTLLRMPSPLLDCWAQGS